MLDQLLNLVKENAGDLIVNNNQVPNQFNEASIGEATNAIKNGLGNALQQGKLQDVLGMFGNAQNLGSNPVVSDIISQFAGSLGGKFGVDGSAAQNIASELIPQVLGKFVNKTNDPNDNSFNINDVIGQLSGGKAGGLDFGNIVSQLQQGGKVDFGGLAGQLLGGKGGGLGDALGGLFGK